MRTKLSAVVVVGLLVGLSGAAIAGSDCLFGAAYKCSSGLLSGGTPYRCDIQCMTEEGCENPATPEACDKCPYRCSNNPGVDCYGDSDCPGGSCVSTPDGKCVICGTSGDDAIIGTGGTDLLCGFGGNDDIRGNAGNDYIEGGDGDDKLYGGDGVDGIVTGLGDHYVEGGSERDTILGATGDDEMFGQGGNDLIVGCGGRDYLSGGPHNDTISDYYPFICAPQNDVLGTLYCGGAGVDSIYAIGPGHVCIDGGPDGATASYMPLYNDDEDVATCRNANCNIDPTPGIACGCGN